MLGDGEEGGEVAAVGRAQDECDDQPRGHQDASRGHGRKLEREVLAEQSSEYLLHRYKGAEPLLHFASQPRFGQLMDKGEKVRASVEYVFLSKPSIKVSVFATLFHDMSLNP